MVKNRKILIEIGSDIAQREADRNIPIQLCKWFKLQLLEVKITPNYQEENNLPDERPLKCPMHFNRRIEEGEFLANNCITEGCAWWSKYHTACAIHTLNEIPQKLFNLIKILAERE